MSMRSAGMPNSQLASITSRPLFISVAESTEILRPITHFGCAHASSGVTPSRSSRFRNGPPDAVSIKARTDSLGFADARQALVNRVVFAVDRQQHAAAALHRCHQQRAGANDRFLVGQQQALARLGGRQCRFKPGGADDRSEHRVALDRLCHFDQRSASGARMRFRAARMQRVAQRPSPAPGLRSPQHPPRIAPQCLPAR